jgi:hypothetical protein
MPAEHIVPGLKLFVTNLVDDGCVIYLNGEAAGRVRMPTNIVLYGTFATGLAPMEGQYDVVPLDLAQLRGGENLLCVEVHQASTANADTVFGQRIVAHVPQLLRITEQPVGTTNVVGETVNLQVGVDGTPAFYQWMKDSIKVNGATNSTLSFVPPSVNQSGVYTVVVTNDRVRLVSDPARVSIFPDQTGPQLLSASVQAPGLPNSIDLTFSEPMASSGPSSYLVSRLDGSLVTVSAVQTAARLVRLTVGGPNWTPFGTYTVTVNNVKDLPGNFIAPNSRVAVSWPVIHPIISNEAEWMFHSIAVLDPFIYDDDWTSRTYVPSDWWAQGSGMFYALVRPEISCAGAFNTDTGYEPDPILFRKTFIWPDDRPHSVSLKLRYLVDDGAVFYLNGMEIYRYNAAGSPVRTGSRALAALPIPQCITNVTLAVSNLVTGVNVLAVAVLQAASGSVDAMFGLAMDGQYLVTPVLVLEPQPVLAVSTEPDARLSLSWAAGGYALERSSDLSASLSYPLGPWIEVTNMTNPYVLSPTNEAAAFYRLKRK